MASQKIADWRVPRTAVNPQLICVLDENGDVVTPVGSKETGALPVAAAPRIVANPPVQINYTTTNLPSDSWTEIVTSIAGNVSRIHIFDSNGSAIRMALGAAGLESEIWRIAPGGDGPVEIYIPQGSRLSIRAVAGTVVKGELIVNFLR